MTVLYSAKWVLPIVSPPIEDGAVVVDDDHILAVGTTAELRTKFGTDRVRQLGNVALLPGFVNAHSHLELTAMRGLLDDQTNFFFWLRKLTKARLTMTAEDLYVSAAWGACEAIRAGITCVGDSSDSASTTMAALRDAGLRSTVFQESFGPDPRLAGENFQLLCQKLSELRTLETPLVRAGISPHAPYTVCAPQLEMIAQFALAEGLPVMMHAAESKGEAMLLLNGTGPFADGLAKREIPWTAPGLSTIRYLEKHRILSTKPLLAHCINVDADDLQLLGAAGSKIAHCPRSNAKLGHGHAPLKEFLAADLDVGMGTDSVASNNSCDVLSEARFAVLAARADAGLDDYRMLSAETGLTLATLGGARAMSLQGQVGELRSGMQADFIAVSLDAVHQIPSYDPVITLMFSSSGRDVRLTVIAGREVYVDGHITTLDEPDLLQRVRELTTKLQNS